eukprot:TRINITY_DN2018_c0_g1_i3.p1 TRINITY_DN2018_c0_g1~~TRINITY_DN2018_c0_g1_i3.p1  ORF type:complete len:426 (-),score=159.21 TRINITY_DN2018_c0_g1_i3:66-1343(-)
MPLYHVYCLIRPSCNREQLIDTLKRACSEVVERGGVVRKIENLGVRHLAYVMRRHRTMAVAARYIRLAVVSHPSSVALLEHSLRTNEDVLRWSTLKQKEGLKILQERLKFREPNALRLAKEAARQPNGELAEDFAFEYKRSDDLFQLSKKIYIAERAKQIEKEKHDTIKPPPMYIKNTFGEDVLNPEFPKFLIPVVRFGGFEQMEAALGPEITAQYKQKWQEWARQEQARRVAAEEKELEHLTAFDREGKPIQSPFYRQERARIRELGRTLQYQSKFRTQVAFADESFTQLSDNLRLDQELLEDVQDTISNFQGSASSSSQHDFAALLHSADLTDSQKLDQIQEAGASGAALDALRQLASKLEVRIAQRMEEKDLRREEQAKEAASWEAAVLDNLIARTKSLRPRPTSIPKFSEYVDKWGVSAHH